MKQSGRIEEASVDAIFQANGVNLRTIRIGRNLTLTELASLCGISQSVLCRVELNRREPSLRLLIRAYAELGVRASDALRLAEDEAFPLGGHPWVDSYGVLLDLITAKRNELLEFPAELRFPQNRGAGNDLESGRQAGIHDEKTSSGE